MCYIIFAVALTMQASCGKKEMNSPATSLPANEIIRIPVVVHVLYSDPAYNISDAKIISQLAVLNQDFRMTNPDHLQTPAEFAGLKADMAISFELATRDPNGNPTSGITRRSTTLDGLADSDPSNTLPVEDKRLFFTAKGGQDAWPRDRYLNIWVVEMSNRHGNLALPGHAQYPGGDARIDGVVIDPRVFGTLAPLVNGHHLGRTATHEIGHWLNLHHIFGKGNNCTATDFVDDTPPTGTSHLGKPVYPSMDCGVSNMFMNFMDYVDDDVMCMFTNGQKKRVRALFEPNGARRLLYENNR